MTQKNNFREKEGRYIDTFAFVSLLGSKYKSRRKQIEHVIRNLTPGYHGWSAEEKSKTAICYNDMSRDMGDLGNQLFQVAAVVAMAKLHEVPFRLPNPDSEYYQPKGVKLNCFELPKSILHDEPIPNALHCPETSFGIRDRSLNTIFLIDRTVPKETCISLHGFWQNYLLANYAETELRQLFTFKKEISHKADKFISSLNEKYNCPIVYVHVRLGDQKDDEVNHPVLVDEYYEKTFELCKMQSPDCKFLIISDEPELCKARFSGEDFIFQDEISVLENDKDRTDQDKLSFFSAPVDLCILSKAETLIMANSTFSWWAAWLADTAKVYAPIRSRWFGNALDAKNMCDFYPPQWEEVWFEYPDAAQFNEHQNYLFKIAQGDKHIVLNINQLTQQANISRKINEKR
jgi:hypothetical protein